jgi:elongation factor Ts
MAISMTDVKELREKTGIGILECKAALEESGGNIDKAIEILRKKGMAKAEKKAGRATKQGRIGSYIHFNGSIGVLVELSCETDFVSRNEKFGELIEELGMHIAATSPEYVSPEEIPEEIIKKEKEIYTEQLKAQGKPDNIIERILEGKIKSFYEEKCLLEQPYAKDPKVKIKELVARYIHELGENIKVKRFTRFQLGE